MVCQTCQHAEEDHRVITDNGEAPMLGTIAVLRCAQCDCERKVRLTRITPNKEVE